MKYCDTINYYLSREFKNSMAIDILKDKLENSPYDCLKFVKFKDYDYDFDNQGTKIRYRVDPDSYRNITVMLDVYDGFKGKKIILEIRYAGNEINIITKTPNEDTNIFHIKHYKTNTVNVLNKRVKFHNTNREETVNFEFAKFDDDGHLLDFKDTYSLLEESNCKGRGLV